MRKRGYFFTLDAFIAVGVIVSAIVLVFFMQSYQPYTSQTVVFAQDTIDLLTSARLSELNVPYVDNLIRNGSISNPDYTLLEQAGEFYYLNNQQAAQQLVGAVVQDLVPSAYGVQVVIADTVVFSTTALTGNEDLLVSSKKIIFGVIGNEMWSYVGEVNVWQR